MHFFLYFTHYEEAYLSSLLQQQLNAVRISHHASTMKWLQSAMHSVDISPLQGKALDVCFCFFFMVQIVARLHETGLRLTLRMRSSTLSWGNDRMAAIVRISRSDNEYLL